MRLLIAALVVLFVGSYCLAEEGHAAAERALGTTHGQVASEIEATPHPIPSADPQWARTLVIVIFAMFLAAIPAGLLIRATAAQEMPLTHSHDEPPGAAGDHHAGAHPSHH
jgi:hypothetical protein